jgi:hypothetical protein
MIVHALQHRTSLRYLKHAPGDGGHVEVVDAADAYTWTDREGVEQAHMALGSFAPCWRIVPLERPNVAS